MSAPKMKKRWINSLKSRAEKEKENQKKLKSQLRPCLICRDDKHVTEKRGSGFLVESLEVGKGIPPHDYLVTSEKVITEFGKLMENYVLKFRNPVKSSKKFTEFRLHEIAASSEPYKPGGDTSGIIFIWLKRESEKFPESRLFSVVLEDLENYENFYCYFANVSSKDFVECLRIKQNGSGKYVVEEDGRSCPTYESLRGNNPGHRPLGGAILIDVQGELRCVGMLDFTDDETETVSPVFFSSIFPRKDSPSTFLSNDSKDVRPQDLPPQGWRLKKTKPYLAELSLKTKERKEEETKNSPKGNYQMEEKNHLLGNRHWTKEREVKENNSHRGNEQKKKKNRKIVLIKGHLLEIMIKTHHCRHYLGVIKVQHVATVAA
ncbi:uncharacterized protein LOC111325005 [Stylophora pistillata]|uniref:uncharacterized protein LOC111325005 n=1 Tax=Stylophora pistillata TaxID=50429 RepID=UPI000C04C7EE|nr:uncharacterized protein LOC111325005 [Stylophora pistillata]